jgi:hypothetical protein
MPILIVFSTETSLSSVFKLPDVEGRVGHVSAAHGDLPVDDGPHGALHVERVCGGRVARGRGVVGGVGKVDPGRGEVALQERLRVVCMRGRDRFWWEAVLPDGLDQFAPIYI